MNELDAIEHASTAARTRLRLVVRGAVQGVGFRPMVFRLATELGLTGWVNNSPQGVVIEVEGLPSAVRAFWLRLEPERPPRAFIQSLETSFLDPAGYATFEIQASTEAGGKSAFILPDIATCPDCLREIFDPANRRYQYPFTNCTHCGPRFSIIQALPYDRPNTTMRQFTMCPACRAEYENPADRRFHAQPNACPVCGPQLTWWNAQGQLLAVREDALTQTVRAIRAGAIVAVQGLGGFHLMADARQESAVSRLRERKCREEKPFALMCPDLAAVRALCDVTELEQRLLTSPESPIVLLRRRPDAIGLAAAVAPGNPNLGVMLPYTPLHHLLMQELGFPIVATSGNLSDEPICTAPAEALATLGGTADFFLVHDRPIARNVDDSIARVMLGRELVLRRARGYAPLPVTLPYPVPPLLAVGAHLKNTVAVAVGAQVFLSQHLGDLETAKACESFERASADLLRLYDLKPALVACDLHPDYRSSQFAARSGLPVMRCQHHAAHVAACLAENELAGPALGVAWDGTGYGPDGTVWGGEFLVMTRGQWRRVAHLRAFPLPGGEAAVKEPRRVALGLLYEMFGDPLWNQTDLPVLELFLPAERAILRAMLEKGLNTPRTTSAGRLFDAVAALALVLGRQRMNFEGQAAMELEWLAEGVTAETCFEFALSPALQTAGTDAAPIIVDWAPMIHDLLKDLREKVAPGLISAKFHQTLAQMVLAVARRVGEPKVALTGGCFQNQRLTELAVAALRAEGFQPYWHQRVPPNDGGIALGQAVMAGYAQQR
ncbi:MAG: carbamoyltransferase HypF [Verrucomicrobiota bacterium]